MAPSPITEHADGAEAGLACLRTLMIQWLADNLQVARVSEPEPIA
ncbi:hypothetical protein [Streptomyces violarus]|nr:hypothetical protein [Streptomyces violarus]